MGQAISWLVTHIAPIFIATSPITSFADQIYSIHRTRSSAGFSLDIPLIMLVASILKVFYWITARFDLSLLIQSLLTICVQIVLLHVALTHRPNASTILTHPFSEEASYQPFPRPYNFWQWRLHRPYWAFLAYFTLTLLFLQMFIPTLLPTSAQSYGALLGYVALGIEATLPIPQILQNERRRGCKGFRLSVLANWLLGDTFKMMFFFMKGRDEVPWAFKLCGIFQATCDAYLGVQYARWGEGADITAFKDVGGVGVGAKEMEMSSIGGRPGVSSRHSHHGADGWSN